MCRYHKIGLVQNTFYHFFEFIHTNTTLVNVNKNATELNINANLDIDRKCTFSLHFTCGGRRRVKAFYSKAIPCFCLHVLISEKRGTYLRKRTHYL